MQYDNIPDQVNEFIGRKIAEFRLQKGISQEDLAKAIGKGSSTAISYFESGLRKVSIEDLFKIAQALDKKVDDFLPKMKDEQIEQKDFALKLRANYKKLDNETQKSILDFTELARKKFKQNEK